MALLGLKSLHWVFKGLIRFLRAHPGSKGVKIRTELTVVQKGSFSVLK